MKLKNKLNVIITLILSMTMLSSTVLAESYYWVSGKSMEPTLENGDLIKVENKKYLEGDMVVARVKQSDEIIVKRIVGNKLVGDNEKATINFDLDEVEILGKAEKEEDKSTLEGIEKTNVVQQAKALGIDSPIEKVYAGAEYVLFLHDNTALTGYGSNIGDVLGVAGGTNKNSAELILISELTGFTHIKARAGSAFGFRPVEGKQGVYNVFNLNTVKNFTSKPITTEVRDYDTAGRTRYINNPHDAYWYADETGNAFATGSDYAGLGLGSKFPFKHYPSGWKPMSAGDFTEPVTSLPTDGWLAQNENNSATDVIITTNEFTTINENFTIDFNYRNKVGEWGTTYVKVEVLDAIGTVVQTFTNPYSLGSYEGVNTYTAILNKPIGNYKLKITSRNTAWDVRVRDRQHFTNAKQVITNLARTVTLVNANNEIFFHSPGWGNPKKVVFDDGSGTAVAIKTETIGGSYSSEFGAIDTLGRIWTWSGTAAKLIVMPVVDGKPFYETRVITEFVIGSGNYIAKSETKEGNITEAWLWGTNNFGKLGDGTTTTNPTPRRYTVQGKVLNDIQSVSSGEFFTVIVQNTPEGQLVWSSGRNNSGQLGGGMQLAIKEPIQMPGVSNASEVVVQNASEIAILTTDDKIYATGATKSYPTEENMSRVNGALANQMISEWEQGDTSYWRESIFQTPTGASTILTKNDRKPYGFGYAGYAATSIDGKSFTPITVHANWQDSFGRTSVDRTFNNVKDLTSFTFGGALVDDQGRLWGWGHVAYPGVSRYRNLRFDTNGNPADVNYAQPMHLTNGEHAPNIFTAVVGASSSGYALTGDGKLWYINSSGVTPLSGALAISAVKIIKIYSSYLGAPVAALDENGEAWVWNSGSTPVKITKDKFNNEKIIDISRGENHTLFVTEQGSVWAFGDNSYGKIGNGTEEPVPSTTPAKVLNIQNAVNVSAGLDSSYAIDKEGRVWAWGYSGVGALGNNFSLDREQPSTSYGNDLPQGSITTNLGKHYFGKNKRTVTLEGTILEPEAESTTISATVLGSNKSAVVGNKEEVTVDGNVYLPNPWNFDAYDEVVPKGWKLEWDIDNFDAAVSFQPLTTLTIVDERGGLTEMNYSGHLIIDNENPSVPTWGQVCLINRTTLAEENCTSEPYFLPNGTNGVDRTIRQYINIQQKVGTDKSPVHPEISYRKKTSAGFYLNDWSGWEKVKTNKDGQYYMDVYAGFQGEAQFKVRAKDLALNVSAEQPDSRYTIITNAGAEISKIDFKPLITNNELVNELKFTAQTPAGSGLISYDVKRWRVGEYVVREYAEGEEKEELWTKLTPDRSAWVGQEITYLDTSLDLKGNTKYKYRVDAENTVAIGRPLYKEIITMPYEPENLSKSPKDDGMTLSIAQDKRNRGTILYRLVISDNLTGEIYTEDKISSNINEEIVYNLVDANIPIQIVNNSIKIELIIRGENGLYHTVKYDNDFVNSPAITNDKESPDVLLAIEGNSTITNNGTNLINLSTFATDNLSSSNNLQVQISHDGARWYGFDKVYGSWRENNWMTYGTQYKNFALQNQTGERVVYARVRDEAGNIGYANTKIRIINPIERGDEILKIGDSEFTIEVPEEPVMHVKNNRRTLTIPKPTSGNISDVQFSFDGIVWSDWEKIPDTGVKKHFSLQGSDGYKAIYTRYRNEFGAMTTVTETDIREYAFDTQVPTASISTLNKTLIVKESKVILKVTAKDNLSKKIGLKLVSPYKLFGDVGGVATQLTNTIYVNPNTENAFLVEDLVPGFNVITFELTDAAGNKGYESVQVFYR